MSVESVDIVVLTVIPPELAAARQAFRVRTKKSKAPDGTVYYRGALTSRLANRDFSIVVLCVGQAGNSASAAAAAAAIAMFAPKAVFLSGIGGGMRKKTKIGDVVFSDRVVAYEPAAIAGSTRRPQVEPRPDTERPAYSMMQDLTHWMADGERGVRMKARFAHLGAKPRAKPGRAAEYRENLSAPVSTRTETVASGEKLVKNPRAFYELQKVHGKIKVVEMEAVGLIEACKRQQVPWLVVRGISDFGDKFKDDRFHQYASMTAAVALADFIAEALQLEPGHAEIVEDSCLARLRSELDLATASASARDAETLAQSTVRLAKDARGLLPRDGDVYFIAGESGRGKTTALRLMGAAAASAVPPRWPLFVNIAQGSTLPGLVRAALSLPGSVDDRAVEAWFSRTPTLVVVDDWHRASSEERARFESIMGATDRTRCAVVLAGAGSGSPLRAFDATHLRLPCWTPKERDALIDASAVPKNADRGLFASPKRSHWVREGLSPQLYELLCEPVLLAKFLEMVRRTEFGALRLPHDLSEVFQQLLAALLASVDTDVSRRAAEVTAVCGRLARQSQQITLHAILAAMRESGLDGSSSRFADDLCAAALWVRHGAVFEFEHDIWRTYFLATALHAEQTWSSSTGLAAWIRDTPISELAELLPFATGMIREPALQQVLFDTLMARDLRLYLQSLRTRAAVRGLQSMAEVERSRFVLTELFAGYIGLVEHHLPCLRPWLTPWSGGDGREEARGEKPVVVGMVTDSDLRYYTGFGPADGEDVVVEIGCWDGFDQKPPYAPKKRCVTSMLRTGDHIRADSTRLVGAGLFMNQLRTLCEKGPLPPVGWIGRERFRTTVQDFGRGGWLNDNWERRSVGWIVRWARDILGKIDDAEVIAFVDGIRTKQIDTSEVRLLVEVGEQLVGSGLGKKSVGDLGLPGPDLPLTQGWFSEFYSEARKLERLRVQYTAVADAYRRIYEGYFGGLAELTYYAQFPARPIVCLHSAEPDPWVDVHWEVVSDWAAATPVVSTGSRTDGRTYEQLANRMRTECEHLGRPFVGFSASCGAPRWAPWDSAVTGVVSEMLHADVEKISQWIGSAG